MNWRDHIHTDPAVLAGKPIVKGTRLSVDFLLGLLAEGWSEPGTWVPEDLPPLPFLNRLADRGLPWQVVDGEQIAA